MVSDTKNLGQHGYPAIDSRGESRLMAVFASGHPASGPTLAPRIPSIGT
jgi:hypothetical protein